MHDISLFITACLGKKEGRNSTLSLFITVCLSKKKGRIPSGYVVVIRVL